MKILAIETSCDETAIAIVEFFGPKSKPAIKILSNIVSSQIKLHAKFGGVVPNLAKREHQRNLVPVLLHALKEAGLLKIFNFQFSIFKQTKNSKFKILNSILEREPKLLEQLIKKVLPLAPPKIDAIAVTAGPGLAPALWVGVNFARALSVLWNRPLVPTNHMEGHLFSALLQKSGKENFQFSRQKRGSLGAAIFNFQFPALALLVSGGHTELVLIKNYGKYKIIGETLDDAAGEAFDKVARLLGLGYPGGPVLSAEAEKSEIRNPKSETNPKSQILNFKDEIRLPRPMLNSKDYNFSFAGLKTAVLYLVRDLTKKYPLAKIRSAIAKEFQNAVVEVLVKKTIRAAKEYRVKTILLGGGVAANKLLRKSLIENVKKYLPDTSYQLPVASLTGDNALMIALAAYLTGTKIAWHKVHADANIRLS